MGILSLNKTGEATYGVASLDQLWTEASSLGKVRAGYLWLSDDLITVEICFKRPSGSSISAKGSSTDIHEAFLLAIKEAKELGAKKS